MSSIASIGLFILRALETVVVYRPVVNNIGYIFPGPADGAQRPWPGLTLEMICSSSQSREAAGGASYDLEEEKLKARSDEVTPGELSGVSLSGVVCFAPFMGKSRVTIMQAPTSVGLRPAPCEFEERKVKESEGREGRRKRKESEGREGRRCIL